MDQADPHGGVDVVSVALPQPRGFRPVDEQAFRRRGPHVCDVSPVTVESFECLDGSFITHLAGKETEFIPGQRMIAEQYEMHGFRNDTAQPATLKVTATPAGDLDRILRTLSGLSRDGLLVSGKPPQPAFAMASLAWRSRYYQPPLPRWLYWMMMGAMAPFGARTCDRLIARYNEEGPPAGPHR